MEEIKTENGQLLPNPNPNPNPNTNQVTSSNYSSRASTTARSFLFYALNATLRSSNRG